MFSNSMKKGQFFDEQSAHSWANHLDRSCVVTPQPGFIIVTRLMILSF
jgi:hypothetical protein